MSETRDKNRPGAKLIHLSRETRTALQIMSVREGTDLKNLIQDKLDEIASCAWASTVDLPGPTVDKATAEKVLKDWYTHLMDEHNGKLREEDIYLYTHMRYADDQIQSDCGDLF